MKRYNYEEVKNFINNLGYILLDSEYINNRTPMTIQDKNGYKYKISFDNLKQFKNPKFVDKHNPYSIENIKIWVKNNTDYKLLSTTYKNCDSKLKLKCSRGHKFEMSWHNLYSHNYNCPKCSHKQSSEETVIYSVAPWMMDLGVSKEDAKKYLPQSSQKITVTCPNCGREKQIKISDIYKRKSIGCSCGDGISYNEKFIISLLDQLNIKYQHDNYWLENKRYDFYFEYNDNKYIIECHGVQHYSEYGFKSYGGRSLQEEQENDKFKKELALKNGIDCYIELDCRKSNINWIKNSIINSKLNNIFNLSKINWNTCEEFSQKNIIKEVCNYWNNKDENDTTTTIGKIFNLSKITIIDYLKKGTKLGWCDYDPNQERKSHKKPTNVKAVEVYKNNILIGEFTSIQELSNKSEELYGIKFLNTSVCNVCRGRAKTHKGYVFKYKQKQR